MRRRIYVLEVAVVQAYMRPQFRRRNPVISRTIEIRADQALQDLHRTILKAFDREEKRPYHFELGTGPSDRNGDRYVLPAVLNDPGRHGHERAAGSVTKTRIGDLNLGVGQGFGYRSDYGGNRYERVTVLAIEEAHPKRPYPRIVAAVGESPPEDPVWDDE